jgi:O-antigen/teichoic acid export membrane protein
MMPAASAIYESLAVKKIKEVFQTTFKYIALIAIPAFLFTSVMADRIIFVWLGHGYEEAAFVFRFLSIAYLINVLTGPGASILTGIGMIEIPFYGGIANGAISVILSLILVIKFGITGIVISNLTANTITTIYFFYYLQKKLGGSTINILSYLKFPFLTSMLILLILSFIGKYIRSYHVGLLSAAILFPTIYILFAYKNPEYGRMRDFIRRPFFSSLSVIKR